MKTRVVAIGLLAFAGACTSTGTDETTSSSSSSSGGGGGSSGVVVSSSRAASSGAASSTGGASSVAGSSSVGGSSSTGGASSVAGSSSVGGGSTSVAGSSSIGGGTSVPGSSSVDGSSSGVVGSSSVGGGTSVAGSSSVGGATSVAGSSSVGGGTSVAGSSSVGGNSSSLTVSSSVGGGSSSTMVGSSSGGPSGCGTVTAFGECNGTVLTFCNTNTMTLVTYDCATRFNGLVQGCGLISAEWGNDCFSPVGDICLGNDGTNVFQLVCQQPGGACAYEGDGLGGIRSECRPNFAACDPAAFTPVCLDTNLLASSCAVFGQPEILDCPALGGSGCQGAVCVGVTAGNICNGVLLCAAGLTCLDDGTGTSRCQGSTLNGSAAITALRTAVDGAVNISVEGVTVSYVKPGVGNDGPGFFLQNDAQGPAMFLAVDPAGLGLNPVLAVGDTVSFTATAVTTSQGQKRVTALTGVTRTGQGAAVPAPQNVSAANDLVTGLDGYESERVTVTGTVASAFATAGTGYQAATFNTAAISNDANLKIRIPDAIVVSSQIREGCTAVVTGTPLWRFNTQAQVMVWTAAELVVSNCPPLTTNAVLVINEVNANITTGCDLVELRVVTGGAVNGMTLRERNITMATLPNATVAKNDVIVVHLNADNAACNPAVAGVTETVSFTESTALTSYPTAWDVYPLVSDGLVATNSVLSIHDNLAVMQDAVFLTNDIASVAAHAGSTATTAELARAAGQWILPNGTTPPADFFATTTPVQFHSNAVGDLNATAVDSLGISIQRTTSVDSNNLNGWGMVAATFGVINVGQAPFP